LLLDRHNINLTGLLVFDFPFAGHGASLVAFNFESGLSVLPVSCHPGKSFCLKGSRLPDPYFRSLVGHPVKADFKFL
jgi:hypothetical protein